VKGPWYSHVTNRWRKWCHIGELLEEVRRAPDEQLSSGEANYDVRGAASDIPWFSLRKTMSVFPDSLYCWPPGGTGTVSFFDYQNTPHSSAHCLVPKH